MTKDEALTFAKAYTDELTEKLAAVALEGRNMAEAAPQRVYEAVAEATGTFHVAWDALTDEQRSTIRDAIHGDIERAIGVGGILWVVQVLKEGMDDVSL